MPPQPRVHVLGHTLVKPATPTPDDKRRTPLSDWDVVMYKSYTPILLFYSNTDKDPNFMNTEALKDSLSKVLVDFYPLAGRLVDVGCGRDEINNCDMGVLFQEAEYNGNLEQYKANGYLPNQIDYHRLFPIHFYCYHLDPLLAVQVTRFQDGGVALGIMILHKVADTYSACFFLDAWAKKARGQEYTHANFKRDLVEPPADAVISEEALAYYRYEHRVIKEEEAGFLRMDPNQQKFSRTSPNGPTPLKSIVLEFHNDGLHQCKKDAHTPEMIANKNWLSTKDALFAMLMRAIARSRDIADDAEMKMVMSVNGRSKMKKNKEFEHYFGNWMISRTVTTTKAEVNETSLVNTAVNFRQALGTLKSNLFHGISRLYTLHEDMTRNYLTYQPNNEFRCTTSDVSTLPFWRVDFGFGRPDRVRGYITFGGNGCIVVFGRGDGTKGPIYDVQVQMDVDSMRRFIDDPDVQKYAKNIFY